MLGLKEVRKKIESINNIRELTSALETLSALKMKRAQKIALLSRPFAQKIAQILEQLEPNLKDLDCVFFKKEREVKNSLICVITSDRGFCGSFNQNVVRLAEKEIQEMEKESKVEVFPIGKKGNAFFQKKRHKIRFSFFGIGDFGELEEIKPISDFLVKSFLESKFQNVYLIWTDFISSFFQKPKKIQILPLKRENLEEFLGGEAGLDKREKLDFLIEPSPSLLVEEIVPQLIEYLIYQSILESNASEHSARMMAMRNASDNAQKRLEELRLKYNKARQEQITSEVSEISSAKEVLEQ